MHNSVAYADYSLQQFFKMAKKQSWYSNTLFVLVADHTPASSRQMYYKEQGDMHIPLVFHHPTNEFFKGRNDKIVSQTDIMPSLLHLLGYEKTFFSFGQSIFTKKLGYSASQVGNKQLYFGSMNDENYVLIFQNDELTSAYALEDVFQLNNLVGKKKFDKLEDHFKAILQTYNHALINNEMTVD